MIFLFITHFCKSDPLLSRRHRYIWWDLLFVLQSLNPPTARTAESGIEMGEELNLQIPVQRIQIPKVYPDAFFHSLFIFVTVLCAKVLLCYHLLQTWTLVVQLLLVLQQLYCLHLKNLLLPFCVPFSQKSAIYYILNSWILRSGLITVKLIES